ncbi:hypothetical protein NKG94_03115 [Micromonospora sp. M12]
MTTTSRYRAVARMIAAIGVVSIVAACSGNGGATGGGGAGDYPAGTSRSSCRSARVARRTRSPA